MINVLESKKQRAIRSAADHLLSYDVGSAFPRALRWITRSGPPSILLYLYAHI